MSEHESNGVAGRLRFRVSGRARDHAVARVARTSPRSDEVSVTKRVVEELMALLRSGDYRVGDRIPSEWDLVERLKVGRSAVREGLRELTALDLLETQRGRGTYVRSLRPDLLLAGGGARWAAERLVLHELLELRLIVEPAAAALAASRATPLERDRLRHDIEQLRAAVGDGYAPPEDRGFHLDVVRCTHNSALSRVTSSIVLYYARDETLPSPRDVAEHEEIFRAIADHNPEAARAAMEQHLGSEPYAGAEAMGTSGTQDSSAT